MGKTGQVALAFKKMKKLYQADPLVTNLPHHVLPGVPAPDETALTEAVLAMELFRTREAGSQERSSVPRSLFYWGPTAGNEIDFLSGDPPNVVPVESKYAGRIASQDRIKIRFGICLERTACVP